MSTTATTPAPAPDPESRAFVDLAHQLLAVLRADAPDAATALDALIHTYVAIVRAHAPAARPPGASQPGQRLARADRHRRPAARAAAFHRLSLTGDPP